MVWVRRAFFVIFTLVLALGIYLTWRVISQRDATPAKLEAAVAEPGEPLASMPKEWVDILITVEDPTFWDNDGTDFNTPGAGMTTITQAVGKQLYFDRFVPGLKKIELVLLAKYALTPTATKEEILNTFLNIAYFGHVDGEPIHGFEMAALVYFAKPLLALTREEYLALVAIVPAPNDLRPDRHPTENAKRVRRIKRLLDRECTPNGVRDVMLEGCAL